MTAVILKILHPFKNPELRVMSSELSAMFTCRDNKGGKLSSWASKMLYKLLGAVYIASCKERLNQSDCWKLFVQLWNYTNILYCTIPYYTILYHAMPCHAMPCHAMPRHATPCHAILYYTILYYTILCYAMLCYAMLCYTILYYTIKRLTSVWS